MTCKHGRTVGTGCETCTLEVDLNAARADLDRTRAELEAARDRIITIADEAFGPFPVQTADEAMTAIERGIFELRADVSRMREALDAIEGYDIDWSKGTGENINAVAEIARRALTPPSPAVPAPKCECDKHEKSCVNTADYLVTRAGKRIAVCDRCTLTGDGMDDRDLNPDWSLHRPPSPGTAPPKAEHRCPSCDFDDGVKIPDGKLLASTPIKRPALAPGPTTCATCGGRGEVMRINDGTKDGPLKWHEPCPDCRGRLR